MGDTAEATPDNKRGRVFVSWSGDLSKSVSSLLKGFIEDVLQQFEVFLSSQDIEKGEGWYSRILTELKKSDYGVLVLTSENKENPWVLFEAGVMLGAQDRARIAPLYVGLSLADLSGSPLNQLQGTEILRRDEVLRLVTSINGSAAERDLPVERLNRAFEKFWPDFEKSLQRLIKAHPGAPGKPSKTRQEALLEDVLKTVQRVEQAVEGIKPAPRRVGFTALQEALRPSTLGEWFYDADRLGLPREPKTAEERRIFMNWLRSTRKVDGGDPPDLGKADSSEEEPDPGHT